MFKTNEYNYHVNPLKPNTLALTLTKKSKRNAVIKTLLPVALVVLVSAGVGAYQDEIVAKLDSTLPDKDNPTKD